MTSLRDRPAGPMPVRGEPSRAATESYEADRGYVLAVLGRRCSWLDPADREAILHDAYAVLLEKQRDGVLDLSAMRRPQIRAYLTQTALNKALDESKRAGRRRSVALEEDVYIDEREPEPDERVDAGLDRARLIEIIAELPERQQTIIKLRFFFERTPQEIQAYLDVTERVYRRELERATRIISARLELVRAGRFCESRRSLILAYVAGIAGPQRTIEARRHMRSCPACAHLAREVRTASRGVAAVVPGPLVLDAAMRHSRVLARVMQQLAGARHHIRPAKEHVSSLAARPDAAAIQIAAASRPGAVTAAVLGCLAAGAGASYCVVHGVPEVIGLSPSPQVHVRHHAQHARPRSPSRRAVASASRSSVTAVVPPRLVMTTAPRAQVSSRAALAATSQTTAQPKTRTVTTASSASAQPEFGFEQGAGSAGTQSSPSARRGATTSKPTPLTAAEQSNEFGP